MPAISDLMHPQPTPTRARSILLRQARATPAASAISKSEPQMSLQALETSPQASIPAKEPRISKRIRQVVELLVTGACQTQKAAAERLDLHPDYVCRELKKPQVQVFIDRSVRQNLANGTMRASARLVQLIDASSEHVSADVSKHMLALAGIKPAADAQVSVNIDIKAGYVIDLTDSAKPAIDVTPRAATRDDL